VSRGVLEGPGGGPRSGKQNDKQNDKRASAGRDLAKVIDAWPGLPEPIKAAMLALVDSTTLPKGKSARKQKE